MSDYPMLISNKLHSFRNFVVQMNILCGREVLAKIRLITEGIWEPRKRIKVIFIKPVCCYSRR